MDANSYRVLEHFMFSNKAHVPLNDKQMRLRDAIQNKMDKGAYKLEECRCLCGSDDAMVIAEVDRYAFHLKTVICKACGILRTNPRPGEHSLKEFYSQEYQDLYFNTDSASLSGHFQAQFVNGVYIKDFISAHSKHFTLKGKSVLEIGCSAGGVLMPFLKAGAVVRGYDYNDRYLEYGRGINKDLDLRHGGIDEVKNIRDRFDLIIINHVLEHLADPREVIAIAGNLLKDDGILYLSVPGIKNAHYYNSPVKSYLGSLHIAHLYHFSRKSLISIMDNFEPVFVDEKVRGIFIRSPGEKAPPFPREYDSNLRYILWRENSITGSIAKKIDVLLYDHYYYTRVIKALHSLSILPKKWLAKFTF